MKFKQYLGICVKCQKVTNKHRWISLQKVWICSPHYRMWKQIKIQHHDNAVTEFWSAEKKLTCNSSFCHFITYREEAMNEHYQEYHPTKSYEIQI